MKDDGGKKRQLTAISPPSKKKTPLVLEDTAVGKGSLKVDQFFKNVSNFKCNLFPAGIKSFSLNGKLFHNRNRLELSIESEPLELFIESEKSLLLVVKPDTNQHFLSQSQHNRLLIFGQVVDNSCYYQLTFIVGRYVSELLAFSKDLPSTRSSFLPPEVFQSCKGILMSSHFQDSHIHPSELIPLLDFHRRQVACLKYH